MELTLFVCSQLMALDSRSNNVSIFNVLEDISSPAFPFATLPIHIVAFLRRTADEEAGSALQLKVMLGDTVLLQGPYQYDFQQHLSCHAFAEIGGLVVPGPGELKFLMIKDDAEWGKWAVRISDIGPQIVQTDAPAVAESG
jgi:hypothetical protein